VVQVVVSNQNTEQALRVLKKKLQREGVFRELKMRRYFEKPSERKKRELAESIRRIRKLDRKRKEADE
jgi:small subunit ribosomal protein S21